jgi:hypothetical protein
MRLTDALRPVRIEGGVFYGECHGLGINEKVVVLSKQPEAILCGVAFNEIYYVSSSSFSATTFQLAPVIGQGALNVHNADNQDFWVARPLDITGYTIDSDICLPLTSARVEAATFTSGIIEAEGGLFYLELDEAETIKLKDGTYVFDVSITLPNGERFYAIEGEIPVLVTRSR